MKFFYSFYHGLASFNIRSLNVRRTDFEQRLNTG